MEQWWVGGGVNRRFVFSCFLISASPTSTCSSLFLSNGMHVKGGTCVSVVLYVNEARMQNDFLLSPLL